MCCCSVILMFGVVVRGWCLLMKCAVDVLCCSVRVLCCYVQVPREVDVSMRLMCAVVV